MKKVKLARLNKASVRRVIKVTALVLSTLICIGSLVVSGFYLTNNILDEHILDFQIAKEVKYCLPVQRCAENNSVNSAKLCYEK